MQNPAMYPTVLPILFVKKGTNNNFEIQRIGGTNWWHTKQNKLFFTDIFH